MSIPQDWAIEMLIDRLRHDRMENPVFAKDPGEAISIIEAGVDELSHAHSRKGGARRIRGEALDIATKAIRLVMWEVEG